MKLTKNEWFCAGKWVGMCLIGMTWAWMACAQTISTTTVQGTVYLANGTPGAGTLQLSWPAFTTAGNQTVMAGRTTAAIGADGFLSVNLAPNLGSMPAGLFYTAVFNMSDGTTSTEYWVVPAATQASIAQVRAQVMPAVQALNAVNKAYVDQAIASLSQSSLTASGGTLSGPLYLNSDPTQPLQAADKRYVDTTFSQAVPLTGASMTGPLTSIQLGAANQVDQFPGADFGAKLQACLGAVNTTYGGTCDARNFTGNQPMVSNLTISTANATVMLPCATISTASQVIIAAGTRNVALRGCALRGASNASGSQGGTVFLYSGAGAMIQVGDPAYAADTMGFHLDNIVINTTGASNSTAQAFAAYRTQEIDLQSVYLLGNSNQTGMTLDGTGNYTGGTFYDDEISGFQTAVNAIGHQTSNPAATDWLNASTFVRLHIDCPTSSGSPLSGTYGINLQQGDGNTFTGGDVEGCNTALHLGPNAQNNTIVGLRNENSNNQVVADSGSSYNSWMTGGTMFTGKLTDNGTRNSFLDTFHRSFNSMNGDWYGSQQDATLTNYSRLGIGAGKERGLLNRYQTDYGYRWTTGLSDATSGEQFYQVLDELNNVYRLSIGQYNNGQSSTNNQTVINAAGSGAIVLNGSNNSGTGGVVIGSGGPNETTVATISNTGNAQFNGTLQVSGASTFSGSTTVRNQADAEIDSILSAGATTNQKESFIYRDYTGASQWYMVKDANNDWALNSATGTLDSFKAYQSTNSGDTYVNASNPSGVVRINYETGAGSGFKVFGGNSSALYASFTGATAIQFPGLAAASGHNCLQIDNSGYMSNTGAACGSGGGTGTVSSGASGQIAYYTSNGTAIAGLSAVPVTAGGTGATTASAALTALGGASLTSAIAQTFAGPVSASAVSASVNTQINVTAAPYNAKGDCATDDQAAIQAAVNAAGAYNPPAVVYFPKPIGGCYLTSTIQWNGAPLLGQPPAHGLLSGGGGVVIKGLPGEDIIHVADPTTVGSVAPSRTWSIEKLMFMVDNTVTGNFPHRWPGKWVADAAMTSGSAVLSSAHAEFSCGDVGQPIQVNGAGVSGANLITTIASVSNCSPLAGSVTTATLAATASTAVSGARSYISVANIPVTKTIGNCAVAFDNYDGNSADWHMTGSIGSLGDAIRDVDVVAVNGNLNQYLDTATSSCGFYFQGVWAPYGIDATNIYIGQLMYGIVEGMPDTNPTSEDIGEDYQMWKGGAWHATYPWISFNGDLNHFEDIQLADSFGPQVLQVSSASEYAPDLWTVSAPEFEQNCYYLSTAPSTCVPSIGWRVEGSAHDFNMTKLVSGGSTAYLDSFNSVYSNVLTLGYLQVNGYQNRIGFNGDVTSTGLYGLSDNGVANIISGQYLSSPFHGQAQTRPAALNANRGLDLAGRISNDFIRNGNVSAPYFNDLDLFFWPQDIEWFTAGFQTYLDANSLTGHYTAVTSSTGINGFATFNTNQSNPGQAMISGSPNGGQVPATKVIVYVSAKCPVVTSYTLQAQANTTNVASASLNCTTAYTTQSLVADYSTYSGNAFKFYISTSGEVDVAWVAARPYQADYNGFQPAPTNNASFTGTTTTAALNATTVTATGAMSGASVSSSGNISTTGYTQQIYEGDSNTNRLDSTGSGSGRVFSSATETIQGNTSVVLQGSTSTSLTVNSTGASLSSGKTFQIGGTQIAASNLSNGTTGTGSVVLAASPALTGTPTVPTQTAGDNSTRIASTAYVASPGAISPTSVSASQNVTAPGIAVSGLVNPSGQPTGTASTTGGTMAAGTYYAYVVAVDAGGNLTLNSAQSSGVTTTGSTSSITWSWTAVTGAVSYQLFVGGSYAEANYFTSSTNSFTETLPPTSGTSGTAPTFNQTGSVKLMNGVGTAFITAANTSSADTVYMQNLLIQGSFYFGVFNSMTTMSQYGIDLASTAIVAYRNSGGTPDAELTRSGTNSLLVSSNGSTGQGNLAVNGALTTGVTKFTTAGCSISSTMGTGTAGVFTLGANSCTAVITMNGATGIAAPNGWTCQAHDRTAPAVYIGGESSSTTTTASIAIPVGAGATDVISFSCMAY